MRQKSRYLIFIPIFIMALFLGACGKAGKSVSFSGEEPKPIIYCPLDHVELEEMPVRPIIVTIGNSPGARPQSGISDADILYEIPAEGGVSRYLAVFYHGQADKIGPVRSARPYLIDIAREYQGVYIHAGGSNDAITYLAKNVIPYINQINHSSGFWRDKSRKAPHNLYTSSDNLVQELTAKKWWQKKEVQAFSFAEDVSLPQKTQGDIEVSYLSSKVRYTYDTEKECYWRYIGKEKCIDENSQEQLAVSNIIVQKVKSKVLDQEGRLSIDLVGSGEAYFFTKGGFTACTWQKDDLNSRTVYLLADGSEITLTPGKTWIQIIDQNTNLQYEIVAEQAEQKDHKNGL